MKSKEWNTLPSDSWHREIIKANSLKDRASLTIGRMGMYRFGNGYYNELYLQGHIRLFGRSFVLDWVLWDYGPPPDRPDLRGLRSGESLPEGPK